MFGKLTKDRVKLQNKFIENLGEGFELMSNVEEFPMQICMKENGLMLVVYLFPNTNPPGGRSIDEYKFNLRVPGQKNGERADFDLSMGLPLLLSYTEEFDVYVIYDCEKHQNFTWCSNVQTKVDFLTDSMINGISHFVRKNDEKLIGTTPRKLKEAIKEYIVR